MTIRYFHYLSDQKVEEAYGQLPQRLLDRLHGELDIPLVPITIGASENRSPTREGKLELVVEGLNAQGQIGSIAVPRGWFRGTLTMKWDYFGHDADNAEVVLFIGTYGDITVALGGSIQHARRTGHSQEARPYSNSGWHALMRALRDESQRLRAETDTSQGDGAVRRTARYGKSDPWEPALPGASNAWPSEVMEIARSLTGPGEPVEFVARWLDQSDYIMNYPVLLGTPLYVASAVGVDRAPARRTSTIRRFLPG